MYRSGGSEGVIASRQPASEFSCFKVNLLVRATIT